MTPPPEKDADYDPLAALDDDLGDDWESAFQAEDFMFSPDDESSDFFLSDGNTADEDEDIAGLMADQDEENKAPKGEEDARSPSTGQDAAVEPPGVLEFPSRLQILAASLLQLFQGRPLHQRLLIGTLPVALSLIIISTLFFQAEHDEPVPLDQQAMVSEPHDYAPPSQGQDSSTATPPPKQTPALAPEPGSPVELETIQQKWKLPTFIIVATSKNRAELIINIDLTLIAYLEKGQDLPADKQTYVKDIIYQFYANRPAHELKRFALARGDMISQLNAWLNKQWQGNPFDTIFFSSYQVTQTAPPLVPKVTIM